jgi:UDP-2,4-diacetamido-2,4,6-trideoxy-beta-L-altropyranose hydrolase
MAAVKNYSKIKTLLIRADADSIIGTGHVMRCMALAQAWQDAGGRAVFVTTMKSESLKSRLRSESIDVKYLDEEPGSIDDAARTAKIARTGDMEWVVTDGYRFGAEYQEIIKCAGLKLLFIDDYGHAGRYCADVILNQNICAREGLYADRRDCTRLLSGAGYVLLRREFCAKERRMRKIGKKARRVLVTLGGSDPYNVTLRILDSMERLDDPEIEVKIVAGPENPNVESLKRASSCSPCAVSILQGTDDMPGLMEWADVAVSAGGSTCWEMAYIGLPFLTVVLSDNQKDIAQGLAEAEVSENLGWFYELTGERIAERLSGIIADRDIRLKFCNNGMMLVDGKGASRVVRHMVNRNRLA